MRSLARLGVEVHGVYADPAADIARHSRLLRTRYRLADSDSDEEIIQVLGSIRRKTDASHRPVVIPTSDRFARFLSAHGATLEADFLFRVPPAEIQTTFLDKRSTVEICRRHDIPIPRTCVPDVLDEVEHAARAFHYPVIIKPASGHAVGFPGKNVIAVSPDELLAFYRSHPDLVRDTVFQELIDSGDGHILYVSTYSGAEGTVLARCSFRKLRQWLPDRGVTSYGVSETLPGLLEQTTEFLNKLGYRGFTGVEFAEDANTGEAFFLELNARAVLPNQLFADAGVDLTAIGYLEMCGFPIPSGLVQRDGVYWINLVHDIPSSIVRWSRGGSGLRPWLRDAWQATSFAVWDRHDLRPFVASVARLGAVMVGLSPGKQVRSIRSLAGLIRTR